MTGVTDEQAERLAIDVLQEVVDFNSLYTHEQTAERKRAFMIHTSLELHQIEALRRWIERKSRS